MDPESAILVGHAQLGGLTMEFRLLGPVSAHVDGRAVDLGSARQRLVLAVLCMGAGHPVPPEIMIDRIWGESPPRKARESIYSYVARIRGALGTRLIAKDGAGYRLCVDRAAVDVWAMRDGLDRAGRSDVAAEQVRDVLRAALDLWTGIPLGGVDSEWAGRTRDQLLRERLRARAQVADAELTLGGSDRLVDELTAWSADDPLAEPLTGLLMRALLASGRRAEALDAYARTRARLADELGEDPGADLQALHQRILKRDPLLERPGGAVGAARSPARPAVVPRQLPMPATFYGRVEELAGIAANLRSGGQTAALYGPGGVGKSALARAAAGQVIESFPDGQLYVDLQGTRPAAAPLSTGEALGRMLRAVGVSGAAVPGTEAEAAALWRSVTADRSVMIVLDNAAGAEQVRPLLPGGTSCGVIVTSRVPLTTLDDAVHLRLSVLAPAEARHMLASLDSTGRCRREPAITGELARFCGYLPLAIRILAARIVARPDWRLTDLAQRLSDERLRLGELDHGDLAVRAAFDGSYRTLATSDRAADRAAPSAFRSCALPDGYDLSLPLAARLLGVDVRTAEPVIDALHDAQLLECPSTGRIRMHDLVRDYGRELAAELDSPADSRAALTRLWKCLAATVVSAAGYINPGWSDPAGTDPALALPLHDLDDAVDWLDAEHDLLVAAVSQSASGTERETEDCFLLLAAASFRTFQYRRSARLAVDCARRGLEIARRRTDTALEARFLRQLGHASSWVDDPDAVRFLEMARTLYDDLGDRNGAAEALVLIAGCHGNASDYVTSARLHEEAVAAARAVSDKYVEALGWFGLGLIKERLGALQDSIAATEHALELDRAIGNQYGESRSLSVLGDCRLATGDSAGAVAMFTRSLRLCERLGNHADGAIGLANLGAALTGTSDYPAAVRCLEDAIRRLREIGDRRIEGWALVELGNALRLDGQLDRARSACELALRHCASTRREEEVLAQWRLGQVLQSQGDPAARWYLQEAYAGMSELRLREAGEARADLEGVVPAGTTP